MYLFFCYVGMENDLNLHWFSDKSCVIHHIRTSRRYVSVWVPIWIDRSVSAMMLKCQRCEREQHVTFLWMLSPAIVTTVISCFQTNLVTHHMYFKILAYWHIPSLETPQTARQIPITFTVFIIRKCELVNMRNDLCLSLVWENYHWGKWSKELLLCSWRWRQFEGKSAVVVRSMNSSDTNSHDSV